MFDTKPELDPRALLIVQGTNSDTDHEAAAPHGNRKSWRIAEPNMMGPSEALDDLLKKVHSGRV